MPLQSPRLAVSTAYSAANYLPSTLKTNKSGWIIEYYVENPQTQLLACKKVKLQRLLNHPVLLVDKAVHLGADALNGSLYLFAVNVNIYSAGARFCHKLKI
jgi:hypothetical protein